MPITTELEPAFHRLDCANPATELHVAGKDFDNPLDRRAVAAFAGEGCVEIDHVKVRGAGFREDQSLCGGIVAVDGGPVHIAFGEAHHLALLQVYGWKYDHCRRAVLCPFLACKGRVTTARMPPSARA